MLVVSGQTRAGPEPSIEIRRAAVPSTTRMPAIKRRSIHCSDSEPLKINSLSEHLLQFLPGALRLIAEDDHVVLAFIEIETEARLNVAFAWTIVGAGDVIDMDQKSAALGVGELNKLHRVITSFKNCRKRSNQLAAGNSR